GRRHRAGHRHRIARAGRLDHLGDEDRAHEEPRAGEERVLRLAAAEHGARADDRSPVRDGGVAREALDDLERVGHGERDLDVPHAFVLPTAAYDAAANAAHVDPREPAAAADLLRSSPVPEAIATAARAAYAALGRGSVAVRSSATAEDLPGASFAGQQDTYLNVRGEAALVEAMKRCFGPLFTARAISYRSHMGFDHLQVALSVGVQKMVRSDKAASGVLFTLDTESGHRGVVLITSSYGLGEAVVKGKVVPDQFYVHMDSLRDGYRPIVWKTRGSKEQRIVYGERGTTLVPVPEELRARFSL